MSGSSKRRFTILALGMALIGGDLGLSESWKFLNLQFDENQY